MRNLKWRLFDKYIVDEKGGVLNSITGKKLQRTVKGYTVGYYINNKFYSLKQLRQFLVKIKDECPF